MNRPSQPLRLSSLRAFSLIERLSSLTRPLKVESLKGWEGRFTPAQKSAGSSFNCKTQRYAVQLRYRLVLLLTVFLDFNVTIKWGSADGLHVPTRPTYLNLLNCGGRTQTNYKSRIARRQITACIV